MQRLEIHLEHVGPVDHELTPALGAGSEERREVAVDLDRLHASAAFEERQRQRAPPGTDLDEAFAGLGIHRGDDAPEHARIVQEMLAEALARADHPDAAQASCEPDRLEQAARIGAAGAGEVERRAVVDRGAVEWQSKRHVDRVAEARVLDHRQALVVVHREHRVGALERGGRECRVRRQRAGDSDAACREGLDRRPDHVDLLAAEVAAFPGVRVEAAYEDAGGRDAERLTQAPVEHDEGPLEPFARDRARHLGERQVRGGERDAQAPGHQQHHRVYAAGFRREVLRVSLERDPGIVDRGSSAPARSPSRRSGRRCSLRQRRPAGRARSGHSRGPAGPGVAAAPSRAPSTGRVPARCGTGRRVRVPFGRCERQAEPAGACRKELGIAREDEFEGPVGKGRGECEVGPDARGLAGRDDDATRDQGFLIST